MFKSYLTLKLTFRPRESHKITKIIPEMDFQAKSHEGKEIHLFLAFFARNQIFAYLELEIDTMTLKMTFYHKNSNRQGIIGQNDKKHDVLVLYFVCYLCLFESIFSLLWPWNWLFYDLELKLNLIMTMNHQNNTLNEFSSQCFFYMLFYIFI